MSNVMVNLDDARPANYWKNRAIQAEEKCAALASELYTVQEIMANPNFTDKEKVYGVVYLQWFNTTKPARPDGSRYYSAQDIAARMGSPRMIPERPSPKEQAIWPVHTKFKKAGLITTSVEPQKYNKSRANQYDLLSPQFAMNARYVALEKSEKASRGGRRVALHRECGGLCVEHTMYTCTKCGRGVSDERILMVDAEKWEQWKIDDIPCVHCTEPVPAGAHFCPVCGGEQSAPAPDTEDASGANMEETEETITIPTQGMHPRGIACPECQALTSWVPVLAEWGGTIYFCGECCPEYKSA